MDIPTSAFPAGSGDTQLWARLRMVGGGPSSITMFYGIRTLVNGVQLDLEEKVVRVSLPTNGDWGIVPIARTVVPPRNLGVGGFVRVHLLRDTVLDLELDEAWLFSMDKGRLTVLDCGTGTPAAGSVHNRLRVSAPSLGNPFGRIEVATLADWSDAYTPDSAKVLCDQSGHRFDPDGASVFTVTTGATDASVSLEHWPRWHSNAGGEVA